MAPTVAPTHPNPYQSGNLIWACTPPLEKTSKLSPKWIGPFRVLKVSNPYQVMYASPRTIHIHHIKPALLHLLAQELQAENEPPAPQPLGYLPSSFIHDSAARNQVRGGTGDTTPQPSQSPPPHPPGVSRLAHQVGCNSLTAGENATAASSSSAVADTAPANRNSAGQG